MSDFISSNDLMRTGYKYQCQHCNSYQTTWIVNCVNCNYDNTQYLLSIGFIHPILEGNGRDYKKVMSILRN
jgi:hypothetical protein